MKKFPFTFMESCAASELDAMEAFNGIKTVIEDGDFENNADLPEWKQRCITNYVNCVQEAWTGSCISCFRYCEGQRDWPFDKCRKARRQEKSP